MGGGWQTYRCERCPLTLELGGSTSWDEHGVVYARTVQVACTGCGTLHRVTEERDDCRVAALPAPIREAARTERLRDAAGVEFEVREWVAEADWRTVGRHPGGLGSLDQIPCSNCGRVAGMLTLAGLRRPRPAAGTRGPEECPVCRGPMVCIGVSDAI